MARNHGGYNTERSEFYGAMQRIVDALFEEEETWTAQYGKSAGAKGERADGECADGGGRAFADERERAGADEGERERADAEHPSREAGSEMSFARRMGISDSTAALLGLRAFDALVLDDDDAPVSSAAASEEVPAFTVRRLDVVIAAEAADLPDELMRIVNLLPPGDYTRQRLCDQINSAITGHAWGQVYGTVS